MKPTRALMNMARGVSRCAAWSPPGSVTHSRSAVPSCEKNAA